MRPGPEIEHHDMNWKPCCIKYCRHTVKVKTNSLYYRPKWSSNKIRILQTKFEFEKKTNLTSLVPTADLFVHEKLHTYWYILTQILLLLTVIAYTVIVIQTSTGFLVIKLSSESCWVAMVTVVRPRWWHTCYCREDDVWSETAWDGTSNVWWSAQEWSAQKVRNVCW